MADNKLIIEGEHHFFRNEKSNKVLIPGIDWSKIFRSLLKSWWILLLIMTICLGTSFLFLRYTKDEYISSSVIQLKIKSQASAVNLTNDFAENLGASKNLSEEIELIRSKLIYDKLIDKLQLQWQYVQVGNVLDEERYKSMPVRVEVIEGEFPLDKKYFLKVIDNETVEIGSSEEGDFHKYVLGTPINEGDCVFKIVPENKEISSWNGKLLFLEKRNKNRVYSEISQNLIVSILSSSASTIQISYQSYNALKCHDIVDAIDSIYLEKTIQEKQKSQQQTINFIESQLDSAAQKLELKEFQLESFVKNNKTYSPTNEFEEVIVRMDELMKAEDLQITQLDFTNKVLNRIQKQNDTISLPVSNSSFSWFPILEEYNLLWSELKLLQSTSKPNTLSYKRKVMECDATKLKLTESLFQFREVLVDKARKIRDEIEMLNDKLTHLPEKGTELKRIQRYYDLYEKHYLLLIEQKVTYGIAKAATVPEFEILSTASYASNPVFPQKGFVYTVSFALFLFFSALVVLVRYLLMDVVMTPSEVESLTNVPLIGSVPNYKREKLEYSKLVVDERPKSAISEALRSIRTNIEFLTKDAKGLFTITSTVSGEGKTFVAINLAGILATSGKKVVLLDLDMRKPKIHLGFDKPNIKGMSSAIIGKDKIDDCIHHSSLEGFDFITSGPTPPNPSELLLRQSFESILTELMSRYDVVIVDTPPVGLVTDGLIVMKKAEVCLYVVRSGYTKRRSIENIENLSKNRMFKNLSIVMNSVPISKTYGGYGYGYGYGYYEE